MKLLMIFLGVIAGVIIFLGIIALVIYGNLKNLAKEGRTADIERFARNLAESQGLDFDKEFNAFRRKFGL